MKIYIKILRVNYLALEAESQTCVLYKQNANEVVAKNDITSL